MNLLFKITYGLYVLSARDGDKYNACIINTLAQQTSNPEKLSITVNKLTYTHSMVQKTGFCSCAVIGNDATIDLIQGFGMRSGREVNKFDGIDAASTNNGCLVPIKGIIGYFDLKVIEEIDMGSHTMFVCEATDKVVFKDEVAMTYAYYRANLLKKKDQAKKEAYICTICGYIHEGPIPDDFICPICKKDKSFFAPYAEEKKEDTSIKEDVGKESYYCTVCAYVHYGPIPDDIICPICKHGRDVFVQQNK